MKTDHLLTTTMLALVCLVFAGCEQAPLEDTSVDPQATSTTKQELITVLNPAIAGKLAERIPLVPRLDSLEGKTIYLVDINWGGIEAAHSFYEEMQGWFARNIPSAKIILRRTQGNMFTDDPALWKEISAQGDAAIVGIAS